MAGSSSLLWDAFESRTGNLGEQVAVEAPGLEMGFGEMWKLADQLAALFLEAGVREGGVAGLALGNSPTWMATVGKTSSCQARAARTSFGITAGSESAA